MNEENVHHNYDRIAAKAQFVARLNRYRDLLQRRWWVLALGALLGLGVEEAISHFEPAAYVSTGRMIVSLKVATPGDMQAYSEEVNNFLGTQAALMQSDLVKRLAFSNALDKLKPVALAKLNRKPPLSTNDPPNAAPVVSLSMKEEEARALADADPVPTEPINNTLKVSLKVTVSPKTSIFVIEGTGRFQDLTQEYVRGCMAYYTQLKKEMRDKTSNTTVGGMEAEAFDLEQKLRQCDDEIVAFQSTNSLVWLEQQGNSVGNYLAALNQKLASMRSEYNLLQSLTLDQNIQRQQEIAVTPSAAGTPAPSESTSDSASQNNSPLSSDALAGDYLHAKQQLLLLKADMEDLGKYLRPKHPKMVAMREEIARREVLLDIFRQQSGEQLENKKASVAMQIQNLEKDVQLWEGKILEISRKSAEYQRIKANSQRIQALYDHLLATMQTLDVSKDTAPESVTILEDASRAKLDKPGQIKKLVAAGLACLALSIGFLLLLDHLDDRVNSLTELEGIFDENVLVQIPREKAKNARGELQLLQPEDERHSFMEAYRNLRSSLLYMGEAGKRPKTLLLTSSVPNEGKSLTASNLAIAMAQGGSRVLLVDADLRKGLLHRRFDVKSEPGFCEVLAQGQDWKPFVQPSGYANLSILARGATTQQSSEFFIGERTAQFIKDSVANYDMVLLDTAPVMAADDVTSLAPQVDGVLFVLRAQYTSARVARAALELLYQRQVNVLGLIFNAVRPSSVDYYYYYKYKDYYYKDDAEGKPGRKTGKGHKHHHAHHPPEQAPKV